MKALWSIIAVMAIMATACGGGGGKSKKDSGDPPEYQDVNGLYCLTADETWNDCNCDGPRDFEDPISVTFTQGGTPAALTSSAEFSGGGLTFTGTLTSTGAYSAGVTDYDPYISAISYEGLFTDSDGDNASDSHSSVDPVHITIEYNLGACCNGAAGSNVIILEGDKVEECPPASSFAPGGALVKFRSDRR
jgi:hypothetical protein